MGTMEQRDSAANVDPLIDEIRGIRREICAQFGNDVDRLFDHLKGVERDYAERRGVFACVSKEAAAKVVESWGDDAYRTDDPLVDEVREIRRKLADGR
ncbi:MAG: hypothetical protein HY287_03890 [Planctomycetes bacterium]|nr:hypothetical protein [Planctomycetota bacterium]MBI3833454.1 hypothetical protein [Planctomycetota bacterium]